MINFCRNAFINYTRENQIVFQFVVAVYRNATKLATLFPLFFQVFLFKNPCVEIFLSYRAARLFSSFVRLCFVLLCFFFLLSNVHLLCLPYGDWSDLWLFICPAVIRRSIGHIWRLFNCPAWRTVIGQIWWLFDIRRVQSDDMLGSNPLPPFQPIKSQARSAELRHIFPALAISSMNSLSDRFLCLLCLSFAILSFPVKNKNRLCDIAITHTRLSIVLYEFLLSILNTKRNSM